MGNTIWRGLLATAGIALAATAGASDRPEPRVVAHVDLQRYAGQWFEIARYANRFQKRCAGDVVARYSIRPDGDIEVDNRCVRADGTSDRAVGVARLAVKDGSNAKLKVRFAPAFLSFIPAVWGDYWVLALAEDYSYSLVGTRDREYLWVLSRTPSLPESTYTRLQEIVQEQGFDPARLQPTKQSGSVPPAPR